MPKRTPYRLKETFIANALAFFYVRVDYIDELIFKAFLPSVSFFLCNPISEVPMISH